jgi:hypothetical protein
MDLDGMSNLYRGPSIDASYQVSVHLAMWFQRRSFLEIDQSETRKLGRKHLWAVLYKEYSFRSNSINKHGHHRQFLFLIGLFLKNFSSETTWPNEPKDFP